MPICKRCAKENPDHLARCVDCGRPLRRVVSPRDVKLGVAAALILGLALAALLIWQWPAVSAGFRARYAQGYAGADPGADQAPPPVMDYAVFETKGHTEFRGVAISFEYPAAWAAETAVSPQGSRWVFGPVRGDRRDVLMATMTPALTPAQLDFDFARLLRDPAAQKFFIPDARNLQAQAVEGLAFPCYLLTYEIVESSLLAAQCRNYVFIVDGHMFHLNFMRMGPPGSTTLDEWAELIQHVARSVKRG